MPQLREILDLSELQAIRRIQPLISIYPWATPALLILGILNSLMEWLGIALLIPLLQPSFSDARVGFLYELITGPFLKLSVSHRSLVAAAFILVAIFLKAVLAYLYAMTCYWLREAIVYELRCRVFSQLMRLGPSYLDTNLSARAFELAISATEEAGHSVSYFVWLLINLSTIGVFSVMLLLLSWRLTCIVGISMALISMLSRRLTARVEHWAREQQQASVELKGRIVESVTGIATICAFAREPHEERRHAETAGRFRHAIYQMLRLLALIDPVTEGLSVAVLVVLMAFAMLGHMPFAILLTFICMLARLQPQVKKLEQNRVGLVASSINASEALAFLAQKGKTYVRSGDRSFAKLENAIEFRSVTFSYPTKTEPALRDVSLVLPKGKMTALVGPSGAGKSTLVHLLCRFYDATAGDICIDGTSLGDFDLHSFRSRLAVVSQDPHIFATSVADNIGYGRLSANRAAIIDAARQAGADEFICALPDGYDTLVGDRGVRLSGGQRQRIAIARAFLCDSEILILDETTNELDGISEALVLQSIRALRSQRTMLVIAHRLSTIEEADQIVVLDQGRVVDQGRLEDLVARDGLFARLYRSQRLTAAAPPFPPESP